MAGALIAIAVAFAYQRSSLGRKLRATREDPLAAQASGHPRAPPAALRVRDLGRARRLRRAACSSTSSVDHDDQVSVELTFTTLAMLVVGGVSSLSGAVLGALLISGLNSFLADAEQGVHIGIQITLPAGTRLVTIGAVMALVLILRPSGITGGREFAPGSAGVHGRSGGACTPGERVACTRSGVRACTDTPITPPDGAPALRRRRHARAGRTARSAPPSTSGSRPSPPVGPPRLRSAPPRRSGSRDACRIAGKCDPRRRHARRPARWRGGSRTPASPPRRHPPPRQTGPTAWITEARAQAAGAGTLASPGLAPPHPPALFDPVSGPAARWIAPSTPPPPSRLELAALTIASADASVVMSPRWSVIRGTCTSL